MKKRKLRFHLGYRSKENTVIEFVRLTNSTSTDELIREGIELARFLHRSASGYFMDAMQNELERLE